MSKSVLVLQLLDLLKTNPTMNARDIARELNRSERTVYRYLQTLSYDLTVPVYYENGYKIKGRPRLAPINFTDEEALALRLALSAAPIRKTEPLNRHLAAAQRKIEAAMSESSLRQTQAAARKVAISLASGADAAVPDVLPVIEQAALKQESLRLSYKSLESSGPKTRIFDPYALVFRKHNWYVIGHCHQRCKTIQLKVARIQSASTTGRAFSIPESFSVDAFYEGTWEFVRGSVVRVRVLFEACIAPLIEETRRHPTQTVEKRPDGSVIMTAEIAGYEEFGWWVLSYGGRAEVLEPPEFREWMAENARQLAKRYLSGE